MLKYRVLIVDDEKLSLDKLERFLKSSRHSLEVERAPNGMVAIEKVQGFKPDLIFLDIEMPGLNGFEFLLQLESRAFKLVFQTAYDAFALRAFEENALDYLLKPFNEERFHKVLDKALDCLHKESKLKEFEKGRADKDRYLSKLTVKIGNKLKIIPIEGVICFVSRDHCTCVHTLEAEYIIELSISTLSERLDPKQFIRIHRNAVVRTEKILSLNKEGNSSVTLSNGLKLSVSRNSKKSLENVLTVH